MHITTHLLIANILYKEIAANMAIELDYMHYVYGNIKPDINPGEIDWPHFSHQSLKDLVNYCETITTKPMSIKAFSTALGVVSHFICDFYCIYHTKEYRPKGIVKHTAYEHLLELNVIKKCLTKDVQVIEQPNCNNVEDTILKYLELYHHEPHSINKDIQYAVNISMCVVKRLIELSEVQQTLPAGLKAAF